MVPYPVLDLFPRHGSLALLNLTHAPHVILLCAHTGDGEMDLVELIGLVKRGNSQLTDVIEFAEEVLASLDTSGDGAISRCVCLRACVHAALGSKLAAFTKQHTLTSRCTTTTTTTTTRSELTGAIRTDPVLLETFTTVISISVRGQAACSVLRMPPR